MPKPKTRKHTDAEIIANARRPERDVVVSLRGDLVTEIEALERELADLQQERTSDLRLSTAPDQRDRDIAEQIVALEKEAEGSKLTFRIRALPRAEWRAAKAQCPPNETDKAEGWLLDMDDVAELVLVESVVRPELEPDDLRELAGNLSEGQWNLIRSAILVVNGGDGSVPFSRSASLILRNSKTEDESLETTASLSNGSTDGNLAPSPRSRSGNKDSRLAG